jgi:hypothetical protein
MTDPVNPLVSEELMDATWRRVAASTLNHGKELQKACGREQPELMGFTIGFSSDLRPEVGGVVFYAHVVISEAFRRTGAKFRTLKPGRIMTNWAEAKQWVESLRAEGRSGLEQRAADTSEPAVFRYIVGALTEDEEDVSLDDDELWHALAILHTVSECLHFAGK